MIVKHKLNLIDFQMRRCLFCLNGSTAIAEEYFGEAWRGSRTLTKLEVKKKHCRGERAIQELQTVYA